MSQRRILVIGSQCKALGKLTFLPQAARDLYAVMTDPERGACTSAIEGKGLLIDPTVVETKAAIKSAYLRAAKDEATLFIAYMAMARGRATTTISYQTMRRIHPTPTRRCI